MSRLEISRVKLNRGGYDRRGRYYGVGEKVWCAVDTATATHGPKCVRAPNKAAARAAFKQQHNLEGFGSGVTIPRAHLREDVREAKAMIRELKRGIARDEKALRRGRRR